MTREPSRSIAVVGSGVAGLSAAHVLSRRDRVTLFEADSRLGGHAHTHHLTLEDGQEVAVDTGFIVHNDRTYPTLLRLFDELGVATQESDMSMSIRSDPTGVEYAGAKGLPGLFPTWRSFTKPRYLRMLVEILRFHRAALALLESGDDGKDEPLEAFLERNGLSPFFIDHFMTPLVAAVWSCDPALATRYPARYLFRFLDHHGMLTVFGSPTWRTVTGGSSTYVDTLASRLDEVLVDTPVHSVERTDDGVCMIVGDGDVRWFDAAVIAVHPSAALAMLAHPTPQESRILSALPYSTNHAQLHTDTSLLPRNERARASWNYLTPADTGPEGVIVTYDMTRLMRLTTVTDRRFLVTLGGAHLVDPRKVIAEMTYEHPLYTPESTAAQARLPEIGDSRIVFAGAYHGWGFHEDGARSGVEAARRLGVEWSAPSYIRAEVSP
ncbi:NAD(P)/FAD-dependent oxidoreductase [Rhodococcus yananensis]|uniref:NAD(P)/FAD-dependent oxidoreductase n=1 Tax=Rhodococcus yananensis TaxID=2879464 RepID=UPI001CF84896|nr:FAD-dependent oxidoreductase [Rhodococcus yananensis]